MRLKNVVLSVQDIYGNMLQGIAGIAFLVDQQSPALSNNQITFQPLTSGYILLATYQGLTLFNAHPTVATVKLLGALKIVPTNCNSVTLTLSYQSQEVDVVCTTSFSYYFTSSLDITTLVVSSTSFHTETVVINVPTLFETVVSVEMRLVGITLDVQGLSQFSVENYD